MSQPKTVSMMLTPRRIRATPQVARRVTFALIALDETMAFKGGRTRRVEARDSHTSIGSRKWVSGPGRGAGTAP